MRWVGCECIWLCRIDWILWRSIWFGSWWLVCFCILVGWRVCGWFLLRYRWGIGEILGVVWLWIRVFFGFLWFWWGLWSWWGLVCLWWIGLVGFCSWLVGWWFVDCLVVSICCLMISLLVECCRCLGRIGLGGIGWLWGCLLWWLMVRWVWW